ncbi:F5/8 type C domain containing protein [Trichomonas vaginalis G3]|uniref:F5/8 type C domain containing protein n=1 Tax=Trichomonas vaginalis (strain ATCC PRA-98 / G3) TaxID=412133 RepID=A2DFY0_TRIV3|nr:galactose-binding domain-like family [Trichomonas vaginalis G3]EAY20607.1 F5/8 type C domain containing protein [Trichomonas vaginalis G3]KAI5487205.1 galactose-binding domain-like family [Trichomonas vaginalis G3]|eukprot:XP_001581593.1 F5/8 type C domain containing protein [Trichomonas vaginalis G3]
MTENQNPPQTPDSKQPDQIASPNKARRHSSKDKVDFTTEIIEWDPEKPFHGIISRISEICMGNPYEKGIINITASSTLGNHPSQVIDYKWNSHWVSDNQPDQWIKFDFKQIKYQITGYSLKTYNYVADGNHLRSWSLQASANDTDWVDIDHQVSNSDLNGRSKIAFFKCKIPSNFRFCRLIQTGYSWCDSNMLALTNIEFYGQLTPDPSMSSI